MALGITAIARFAKALQAWVESDATLVSLTGHVPGTDERIFLRRGNDRIKVPCLILDLVRTTPYLPDIDGVILSKIYAVAIGASRIQALDIVGAMHKFAKPSRTTLSDASFSTDNIRTRSITAYLLADQGKSEFDISSVRRTERSDTPIPERNVAVMDLYVVWSDTL